MAVPLTTAKIYQNYGIKAPYRGALAMTDNGAHGENFKQPEYLVDKETGKAQQGWGSADGLWFYYTTQGSALLPYDFFLVLEQAWSEEQFRSPQNIDKFRYLPQEPTRFNPDGLPVGFVKDTYKGEYKWYEIFSRGKDYVGHTCAACHTGQINYTKPGESVATAIRIDGGPAMADMIQFLIELQEALEAAQSGEKGKRFVQNVLELNNDYSSAEEVLKDLTKWTAATEAYNIINHSKVDYGYARLDAFGRIYNRVLQYVISTDQAKQSLSEAVRNDGTPILEDDQITILFKGIKSEVILGNDNFNKILHQLDGLNLSKEDITLLRNRLFNPANAPVSYPFLWDIAQSDYVQWNGLANNAGIGPLGRNTGEAIGVFGILDWEAKDRWLPSLSALISGQKNKKKHITFTSSIDISNLQRMERKLRTLKSPVWPEHILGGIDRVKAARGQLTYNKYCIGCHEVIDRNDADRLVVGKMMNIDLIDTDRAAAENSVNYKGQSGNFEHTIQEVEDVGGLVVEQEAPVVQLLTWAARGVIATPDPDKWFFRRWAERIYNLVASFADNKIEKSVKAGNYEPNTTAQPYNSLLSYKARSLNGIWATAPYLHNGSVPTLYDLLLPAKRKTDPEVGSYRPSEFYVGSREFDPKKVGFRYDNPRFTRFDTSLRGNSNHGHEYGAGRSPQADGRTVLRALSEKQRWDLVEYLKSL